MSQMTPTTTLVAATSTAATCEGIAGARGAASIEPPCGSRRRGSYSRSRPRRTPQKLHPFSRVSRRMAGLLAKERIIAAPGFNRWLVPPAALAIHLSIGMAYGFSVFWLPLSRAIGITQSAPDDWKISTLGIMYSLFFLFLGSSAAVFGRWVEREGPRKAGLVAAFCWGGGFFISALGVRLHQIRLLWIGSGGSGGGGLGPGLISPPPTPIKRVPPPPRMGTRTRPPGVRRGARR